jgi:hypothetical protein
VKHRHSQGKKEKKRKKKKKKETMNTLNFAWNAILQFSSRHSTSKHPTPHLIDKKNQRDMNSD